MRPLAPADLSVAARALLSLPEMARPSAIARMIAEAEAADRYRRRMGRGHPFWGNGTLEAAARAHSVAPQRALSDGAYLSCLALVLDALTQRRPNFL